MMITDKLPWRIQSQLGYRPKTTIGSFNEYSKQNPKLCKCEKVIEEGYSYLNPPKFNCEVLPANFRSVLAQYYSPAKIYTINRANIYMNDHQIGVITKNNKLIIDNTFNYDADYSKKHPFLSEFKTPTPIKKKGKCLVLAVSGGDTFYWHWMIDSIPKYGIIELVKKSHHDFDYILINEPALPCHKQTIDILGIPEEKLLVLKNGSMYSFDEMTIPSELRFNPWVVHYLRNRFLPYNTVIKADLNIYVSRQKARWRKIENEDELFNLLEKKYGFIKVFFEDLTVPEQINLSQRTKTVISLVGSNQINMVFYSKGANIIELQPIGLANIANWEIAEQCGHNYQYFECSTSVVKPGFSRDWQNIVVDIENLEKYLREIL